MKYRHNQFDHNQFDNLLKLFEEATTKAKQRIDEHEIKRIVQLKMKDLSKDQINKNSQQ